VGELGLLVSLVLPTITLTGERHSMRTLYRKGKDLYGFRIVGPGALEGRFYSTSVAIRNEWIDDIIFNKRAFGGVLPPLSVSSPEFTSSVPMSGTSPPFNHSLHDGKENMGTLLSLSLSLSQAHKLANSQFFNRSTSQSPSRSVSLSRFVSRSIPHMDIRSRCPSWTFSI
jgi:hypothetical protein